MILYRSNTIIRVDSSCLASLDQLASPQLENKSGGKARSKLSKKGNGDGAVAQSSDGDDEPDDEPNDKPDVKPDDAPGTEPNSASAAASAVATDPGKRKGNAAPEPQPAG